MHIALLAPLGCSSSAASPGPADATDAAVGEGGDDASPEAEDECNCSCCCVPTGVQKTTSVSPDVACELAASSQGPTAPVCVLTCGPGLACSLDQAYLTAYTAAQPVPGDAATTTCPSWSGTVAVSCYVFCMGRLTQGIASPARDRGASPGETFAACAFLEAASVHAFERLERELAAHGAPPVLLREARRARRDEVRHTAVTTRLARRHGVSPRLPDAPARREVRSLFEVALENAVEGCIRETYGAAFACVQGLRESDPEVRRAMRSIAPDECRHAELAWEVAAWARARLGAEERSRIDVAMREAIAELRRDDPALTALLEERVWRRSSLEAHGRRVAE